MRSIRCASLAKQVLSTVCVPVLGLLLLSQNAQAQSAPVGTEIINVATATFRENLDLPPTSVPSNEALTEVEGGPVLKLRNEVFPTIAEVGDTVSYTLIYTNTGNAEATSVTMVDQLSSDVEFVSANGGGVFDPGSRQVSWNLGTLAAGASATRIVEARVLAFAVSAAVEQPILNIAEVSSTEGAEDEDVSILERGQGADFIVGKSVDRTVTTPGGVVTYEVVVANSGTDTASNARILDALPSGTALIPDSVNFPYEIDGQNLEIMLGDVASQEVVTAQFSVAVSILAPDGQVLSNQAAAIASGVEPRVSNKVQTRVVASETGRLELTLTPDPNPVYAGGVLAYTLEVTNTGSAALSNVELRHPLPQQTEFDAIEDGGNFQNGEARWLVGELLQGASAEVGWSVIVDANAPGNTTILTTAYAAADDMDEASTQASTFILDRTVAEIGLYDSTFSEERAFYSDGDTDVFIEVADADQNVSDDELDRIQIVMSNVNNSGSAVSSTAFDLEIVELIETNTRSGVFQGSLPFSLTSAQQGDGALFVESGGQIFARYSDPIDSTDVEAAAAVYEPAAALFNALSGVVVPGVTVRLVTDLGTPPNFVGGGGNEFVTDQNGLFEIPALDLADGESVTLQFEVDLPPEAELIFPSVVPDENLPDTLSSGKSVVTGAGSRGELFTVTSDAPIVSFDLPLDPPSAGLRVEKTSRDTQVAVGEIVTYEIRVINASLGPVAGLCVFDSPPREFRYLEGSSTLDGESIQDPNTKNGQLLWILGNLDSGEDVVLTYRMMIGVDAKSGTYTNSAYATTNEGGEGLTSETARHEIRVTEGIFTRNGIIIGRVFVDLNDNARFDPGEPGMPEAFVYMEDGSYAITDSFGRYSMKNVKPGQHVLRLDGFNLPNEVEPAGRGGHFMDRTDSQWLEMHASGLMKANFPVKPISETARVAILERLQPEEPEEPEASKADAEEAAKAAGLEQRTRELEALVKTLESDFKFVNLVDGQQLAGRHTDVRIQYPLSAKVELRVNGERVPADRLGAKMQNPANKVELVEYVAVRLRENIENTLTATMTDPFGNVRGEQSVKIYTLAKLEKMDLKLPDVELIADGQSEVPVEITLIDSRGNVAKHLPFVTVDAGLAFIVEDDLDPVNAGHQVAVKDGVASFTLRAPRKPGDVTLYVKANDVLMETELSYKPYLRDLFVMGSGEVMLGSGDTDGDIRDLDNVFDDEIEDGNINNADVAFFAKGDIGFDTLLTATYDSDKKQQDDYFQARETDVDDESLPMLTGDGSVIDYEGYSRDPLYLRLDRHESNAMWGDYNTEISEDWLSQYSRTYTGFRSEVVEGRFKVTSFAAEMEQDQIVDAIPARGVSGYYYLSESPVVFGSERIVVETRDRLRPDRVIRTKELIRNEDYEIDYYTGSILTYAPIPTYDLNFNPNIIIATYEIDNEANDNWAYGARVEAKVTEDLVVAATHITEEGSVDDYTIQGVDATYTAKQINTTFKAEYAQTESVIDDEGLLNTEDGDAYKLSFEGKPLEELEVSGYYQEVDEFFINTSATDARRGTTNFGADAEYDLTEFSSLTFEAYQEKDDLYENEFNHVAGGVKALVKGFNLGAEVYHDEFKGDTANYDWDDPDSGFEDESGRYPFDSTPEQVSQDLGLKLSADTYLMNSLTLGAEHSQDLDNTSQSLSQVRLGYEFGDGQKAYLTERYDRYDDRDELRTIFGLEAPMGQNTTRFVEYQYEDDSTAQYLRQSSGIRHQYKYGPKLSGNASYENLSTLTGDEGANRPDGYAVTVSNTYLPSERWRLDSRVEYRDEDDFTSTLTEMNCSIKVSEDLAAQWRVRYFDSEGERRGDREDIRISTGFAWRPTESDRFHALGRLDWEQEDESGSGGDDDDFEEDKVYGSIEGIYDLTQTITLTGKYAGKQYELDSYSLYNDMVAFRTIYMHNDRYEFGATVRYLNEYDLDNSYVSGAVDFGFNVWKFVWMTVGYSYDEFDADLAGQDYSGEGVFVKFRFKFDENSLDSFKF